MGCGAAAKASGPGKYSDDEPAAELSFKEQSFSSRPPPRGAPLATAPAAPAAKAHVRDGDKARPAPRAVGPSVKAVTGSNAPKNHRPTGASSPTPEARASALTEMFRKYEANAAAAVSANADKPLEPLVSPENTQQLAHILGADLVQEPFLVPAAKLLLPSLAAAFRDAGQLRGTDVKNALDLLDKHRDKEADGESARTSPVASVCAECGVKATCYCADCEDKFCEKCFRKLHAKGNRARHARLDVGMVGFKVNDGANAPLGLKETKDGEEQPSSLRKNTRWHAFNDAWGMRYFYNFDLRQKVLELHEEELAWQPPPPLLQPAALPFGQGVR